MVILSDHQFLLCKAALIFAVTRFILSFALNLLTTSMDLFSPSSCCSSSSSSSSAANNNLRIMKKTLSVTTVGDMIQRRRLPENQDDAVSCAVCLNMLRKKSQVWELRNCSHVFHKHCLERWLAHDSGRSTCPLCRASLLAESSPPPVVPPSWAVERMLYLFGDDLLP